MNFLKSRSLKHLQIMTQDSKFLSIEYATQDQVTAALDAAYDSLHRTIHAERDLETLTQIALNADFSDIKSATALTRSVQRMMARAIGYTDRAMQLLCVKHGLSVLNPERLQIVLINKQRKSASARAWIREQEEIKQAERSRT